MSDAATYLIQWYREQPPTASRERARQLREIWFAYPLDVRKALQKECGSTKPRFPQLSIPPALIDIYWLLSDAQAIGQDVSACWDALDEGLAPADVHRVLLDARANYSQQPSVPFASHLATLFDDLAFASADAPVPQRQSVVGLHLPYDDMAVRWIKSRAQLHHQSVPDYVLEALKTHADRHDATRVATQAVPLASSAPPPVPPTRPTAPKPLRTEPKQRAPKKQAAAKRQRTENQEAKEKGPPLHEKIWIVMGAKEMTIDDVIAALEAHDPSWVPKSRDLNAYISLVLSTHLTDYFDRVKRGIYKAKPKSAKYSLAGGHVRTPDEVLRRAANGE